MFALTVNGSNLILHRRVNLRSNPIYDVRQFYDVFQPNEWTHITLTVSIAECYNLIVRLLDYTNGIIFLQFSRGERFEGSDPVVYVYINGVPTFPSGLCYIMLSMLFISMKY